jgi:environmental stress-induced protein Ves
MRILRAADHKRMPWKNGGGETVEIAVFPEGAGLGDFDWRVSMARVEGDGPFSSFPGIDRTLAILDGAGIVLEVEGHAARRLTCETPPHSFPADAPTAAALIAEAVTDFNVMSRRGRVDHTVERLHDKRTTPAGFGRLILCTSGEIAIGTVAASERLSRYDAALLSQDEAAELAPNADSEFYLVEFRPA